MPALTPEPDIPAGGKPEAAFERAIVSEIRALIEKSGTRPALIPHFGLDLAVFAPSDGGTTWWFFEFKAYMGQRRDGCGFGTPKGTGPQVELLLLPDHQLAAIDRWIRFALMDGLRSKGERRFAWFGPLEAKGAAMNGVRRGKQNNFRVSQLMRKPLTWDELSAEVEEFLGLSSREGKR
ncbi:MAG: hypothetical protein ACRD2Y_02375 [Terriglobales bacterium]